MQSTVLYILIPDQFSGQIDVPQIVFTNWDG